MPYEKAISWLPIVFVSAGRGKGDRSGDTEAANEMSESWTARRLHHADPNGVRGGEFGLALGCGPVECSGRGYEPRRPHTAPVGAIYGETGRSVSAEELHSADLALSPLACEVHSDREMPL